MIYRLPAGQGPDAVVINTPSCTLLMHSVEERLRAKRSVAVATINLDHLVKLQRSGPFRQAYDAQDFVVADGNPVVWLSRLSGRPVELVPGSEPARPLAELAASGASFCLLALGGPNQERFAVRGKEIALGDGFVSVGVGVELVAGSQVRAPVWVQKVAMEWLWRMMRETRRLFWRYMSCFAILPALIRDAWRLRGAPDGP